MFKLNLLTPERKAVYDEEISEVTIPAHSGEMTILPGHAPLITTLGTGILKYKLKGQEKAQQVVISWGYCEVAPGVVNVLAEFLQTKEESNLEKAKAQILESETKLAKSTLTDDEFEATLSEAQKGRSTVQLLH